MVQYLQDSHNSRVVSLVPKRKLEFQHGRSVLYVHCTSRDCKYRSRLLED